MYLTLVEILFNQVVTINEPTIIKVVIIKYKPIFVKDISRSSNISALRLNKFFILN